MTSFQNKTGCCFSVFRADISQTDAACVRNAEVAIRTTSKEVVRHA